MNKMIVFAALLVLTGCAKATPDRPQDVTKEWVCKTKSHDTFTYTGKTDPVYYTVIDADGYEREERYTVECKSKVV